MNVLAVFTEVYMANRLFSQTEKKLRKRGTDARNMSLKIFYMGY